MSTSLTPTSKLRAQAKIIAVKLKKAERGEAFTVEDPGGTMLAARKEQSFVKFGVVMDDKMISIEMPWDNIREMSIGKIIDFIVAHMKESRAADTVH